MKKWGFWLVMLLLLGYGATKQIPKVVNEHQPEADFHTDERTINVTKEQIYKGDLLLVNKNYPVHPEGVASGVVNLFQHKELVKGYGLLDNTIQLSPSLAEKFSTMIEAAKKDGVTHFLISSGYRSAKEQNQLYQEMGADYAMPAGSSEHNLGLSIDIGSTQVEMNKATEGKWLQKNAWKYGFILRYPKEKTAITGIQYEPWHFRYVGLPHSAIMQEKNFVLEQYLDFLKEQKTISTIVDHKRYEISYYPVSKSTTIRVPANYPYEISGNNMDGVIVTVQSG